MQNSYNRNDRSSSAYEVADLMYDIGTATLTTYGCEGSGTLNFFAVNAFTGTFNYSDEIVNNPYSYQDVKNELIWGRPVILGGYSTEHSCCFFTWYSGGHSWVADGFREDYDRYIKVCEIGEPYGTMTETYRRNYRYWIHMNWGWGGPTNGWYFSNELTHPRPHDQNDDYRWQKDMIIRIHP